MLSKQRPRLSMLMAMSRVFHTSVNFSLANCEPWSLLKISGLPRCNARRNASTQKSTSIVTDSDQLGTYRLYQSITATKYAKPSGIRM